MDSSVRCEFGGHGMAPAGAMRRCPAGLAAVLLACLALTALGCSYQDPWEQCLEDKRPDAPSCSPACQVEGLRWVEVPAGEFMMGCSEGDDLCESDELPRQLVKLPAFEMLETEVTNAQTLELIGELPSCDACMLIGSPATCAGGVAEDEPVACVDWPTAQLLCESIGGRLPTEAEWEYAARGGVSTRYYCGTDSSCLDGIAWWVDNTTNPDYGHGFIEIMSPPARLCSLPVAGKTPNGYGLYDMLGNVSEWTGDSYIPTLDPSGRIERPYVTVSGEPKTIRGGCTWCDQTCLRVSSRWGGDKSSWGYGLGFRCARDVQK